MKVLILLSGGLDSAVVLAAAIKDHECEAIGFDYDQPHAIELDRAEEIAEHYGVPFVRIGLPAMLNAKIDDVVFAGRNLVLASLAIATAQARGMDAIAIGCNASDWPRFPDCRPPFWSAVRTAAEAYGIAVLTPLTHHSKQDVASAARRLGVPIDLTWSCYAPRDGSPCGECLACKTRDEALSA